MRTLTAQETNVLAAAGGYQVRFRVQVYVDAASAYKDMSAYEGVDWCEGASWSEDLETGSSIAAVQLRRDVGLLSLAPLRTDSKCNNIGGSYSPFLREGAQFYIETATLPLGIEPQSGDWREVFRGLIDDIDAADEVLTFSGRDLSCQYQDTFIETEIAYSGPSGTPVQTVMGSILTDNGFSSSDLVTPVSPSWNILGYLQRREPLLDALRVLATQIGWSIQYRWVTGTGFRLVFFEPERTATTPAYTFGPESYEEITTFTTSRVDVRNVWEVFYSDAGDLDAAGQPKRKTASVSDATSITAYGRRYASIGESSSSAIDTGTEATRLANAALADTKDVLLTKTVKMPYFYAVQIGDLMRFSANSVQTSGNLDLAVISISHSLGVDEASTSITVRGKPSLSPAAWLEREQRPGTQQISRDADPPAVTSIAVAPASNGLSVTFVKNPEGRQAVVYQLHVSTTPGFTPGGATLKAVSQTTRFDLAGLSPGVVHYLRVIPVAQDGTLGTATSEQSVTPTFTGPGDLLPAVDLSTNPPNGNFEVQTNPLAPPDCWTMLSGTWGTHATLSSTHYSGTKSLYLVPGAGGMESQSFLAAPGKTYIVNYRYMRTAAKAGVSQFKIRWLDSSGSVIQTDDGGGITTTSGDANVWKRGNWTGTAPANTAFGKIRIVNIDASNTETYYDAVDVREIKTTGTASWYGGYDSSHSAGGTYQILRFSSEAPGHQSFGAQGSTLNRFYAPAAGWYHVTVCCYIYHISSPSSAAVILDLRKNGTVFATLSRATYLFTDATLSGACTVWLEPTEYLEFALFASGAGKSLGTGNNEQWCTFSLVDV